jgi:uncharacterized protein YqgV (UPF0045/DUF77 family)
MGKKKSKLENKDTNLTDIDPAELKIIFAPGCFDQFEGTQEELDDLIKQIHEIAKSGELLEKATPIDIDEDDDTSDEELIDHLLESNDQKRNLQ